jgi:hypothetical protein
MMKRNGDRNIRIRRVQQTPQFPNRLFGIGRTDHRTGDRDSTRAVMQQRFQIAAPNASDCKPRSIRMFRGLFDKIQAGKVLEGFCA